MAKSDRSQASIKLPADLKLKIEIVAASKGMNIQQWVTKVITPQLELDWSVSKAEFEKAFKKIKEAEETWRNLSPGDGE